MEPDPSSRKQAVTVGYIFAAAIGMLLLQWVLATYNTVDTIPYSEFEQLVAQGNVTEVAVGQDTIQGKLKDKLAERQVGLRHRPRRSGSWPKSWRRRASW